MSTLEELQAAARGNFDLENTTRAAYQSSPRSITNYNAQAQALARASGDSAYANNRNAVAEFSPIAESNPMLEKYQKNIGIGQSYSPTMGLSEEGKYSGFYTSSDRHNAILGRAMEQKDLLSTQLRDLAKARYSAVDSTYNPLAKSNQEQYTKSAAASRIGTRIDEPESVLRDFRARETALKNWYTENVKPANEASSAAFANDRTPLSKYATAIASRDYRMNPYAAAGEFNAADSEVYKGARDQDSMRDYGMTYDELNDLKSGYETEVEALTKMNSEQLKSDKAANISEIETLTGMNISTLKSQTGSNEENIYNLLFDPTEINIPVSGNPQSVIRDAATLFNEIKKNLFIDGNYDTAVNYVRAVEESNPELAQLLRSYIGAYSKKATDTFENMYDPYPFLPDQ